MFESGAMVRISILIPKEMKDYAATRYHGYLTETLRNRVAEDMGFDKGIEMDQIDVQIRTSIERAIWDVLDYRRNVSTTALKEHIYRKLAGNPNIREIITWKNIKFVLDDMRNRDIIRSRRKQGGTYWRKFAEELPEYVAVNDGGAENGNEN